MSINLQSRMLSIRWWQKKSPRNTKDFHNNTYIERKSCLYAIPLPFYSSVVLSTFIFIFPGGFASYKNFVPCKFNDTLTCRNKMKEKILNKKHNILLFWPNKCRENHYAVIVTQSSFMVFQILLTASHLMGF